MAEPTAERAVADHGRHPFARTPGSRSALQDRGRSHNIPMRAESRQPSRLRHMYSSRGPPVHADGSHGVANAPGLHLRGLMDTYNDAVVAETVMTLSQHLRRVTGPVEVVLSKLALDSSLSDDEVGHVPEIEHDGIAMSPQVLAVDLMDNHAMPLLPQAHVDPAETRSLSNTPEGDTFDSMLRNPHRPDVLTRTQQRTLTFKDYLQRELLPLLGMKPLIEQRVQYEQVCRVWRSVEKFHRGTVRHSLSRLDKVKGEPRTMPGWRLLEAWNPLAAVAQKWKTIDKRFMEVEAEPEVEAGGRENGGEFERGREWGHGGWESAQMSPVSLAALDGMSLRSGVSGVDTPPLDTAPLESAPMVSTLSTLNMAQLARRVNVRLPIAEGDD